MAGFTWRDGDRTIRFGRGAVADAPELLGDGYVLLTTRRGRDAAPEVAAGAAAVHDVPGGRVDELAGDLLGAVERGRLVVGLGGGRVVDVAKAVAAATGGSAASIPTTLSAAEMTGIHRRARGAAPGSGFARPRVVINDPALSASQPPQELAASAANALGHAVEGPLTPRASPVPRLVALEAVRLLSAPHAPPDDQALGALLAGYVIDSTGYGLHHVLAQTLARVGGAWHGHANAAMLPHSIRALRRRAPELLAELDAAAGIAVEQAAAALAELAGAARLRDVGVTREALEDCVREAAARPDLAMTPPPADEAEIRALYDAAW